MNVDLHTHTYPASDCSHISFRDYVAWCVEHGVEAVALTNHGDVSDNRKLGPALAAEGVLLVHGVEISTLFGDFVVFAELQDAPRAEELPRDAAVAWVHPAAGGGRSGSAYYPGLERMVAGVVDAVEVYNGNWLAEDYVKTAEQIAAQLGAARTGGSDGHVAGQLMACYTELPDPVRSTADVVDALKQRRTVPHRAEALRKRRFGVF
jgi:predicted metal-dependent phosphoesterase TrpH